MQQQQRLLSATPRKKKELSPSPWWDFFGHCKEAADSSSDSEDDTQEQNDDTSCAAHANYNVMCATGPTNSSNDDLIIKEESAPIRIKSIGTRFNSSIKADGDTPRTHASSTCFSFPNEYGDHDNERIDSSLQPIGIEVEMGDIEDSVSDDDCNFIGYVDIMPISPLLSTQQRNIRKNAYDLLKRLGEEESMFDLNSIVAEVEQEEEEADNCRGQRLKQHLPHQMRVHEEVDELKRQLRECINLVSEIHANLRSYSNDAAATNDNDVASAPAGMNNDDEAEVEDENIMATLDTEIATLKSLLQSATLESRLLMHGSRRDFPLPIMDRESSMQMTDDLR